MKKLIALTLSASLLMGSALALTPEEAFPKTQDYPGFSDVQPTDWFASTAQTCYEVGLITGTDRGFEPTAKITVGSVAAIAARMNAAITGKEIPASADPSAAWYQRYLDYLAPLGVTVDDPSGDATRLEFLKMLAAVIPDEMLAPRNTIDALPDTSDETVLKFYRAGILTGVDEYGTFVGDRTLMRAEVAAMVARIARTEQRTDFTPKAPVNKDEALLLKAAGLNAGDILFFGYSGQLTAAEYLPRIITEISVLEASAAAQGVEFNWHTKAADGRTYLQTVEENALAGTGLTSKDGTELWRDVYDTQVFYSRYIDLTGNHL